MSSDDRHSKALEAELISDLTKKHVARREMAFSNSIMQLS